VVKAFNTIFAQLLPAEAREGRDPVQVFDLAQRLKEPGVAQGARLDGLEPALGHEVGHRLLGA
jgi:hypothetical protein